MKLLITGAKGPLGNELQRQLLSMQSPVAPIPECYRGAEVVAIDLQELDLTDRAAVHAYIKDGGFDLIINCAAFTNVNACETEFDLAFKVNALAPRYLAEAAEASGAKLIHVSTDYVFRGDGDTPLTEADATGPVTAYGKTKLLGEDYVREACSRYFIARVAWLYGYKGKNFVKTITGAAKKFGKVKVVNDQFGNPTSAVDVATHLLLMGATENYGVYHCTNNGICSWYDFTCEILRLSGINAECAPCTTEEYPTPAARPAYSALDNVMLRLTVGDHMRPWQEAIAEYIKNLPELGD